MKQGVSAISRLGIAVLFCCCGESTKAPGPGPGAQSNMPPPTVTPVGVPMGTAVAQTVGAAGGKVMSGDGRLTVTIPPGALASDASIELQPISNQAWGGRGVAYRLLPHGQKFAAPVTLAFHYTEADLEGAVLPALGIAYQDKQGNWRSLPGVERDASTQTIRLPVTHFSDWSMVAGWQLRPGSATIQKGQQVMLEVADCERQEIMGGASDEDQLYTLLSQCTSADPDLPPLIGTWAVNGRRGGGADVGTVSANGGITNTYVAPTNVSGTQTFAVSVEMLRPRGRELLVSNITVTSSSDWTGTVRFTRAGMRRDDVALPGCPANVTCLRSDVTTTTVSSSGTVRYAGPGSPFSGAVIHATSVSAEGTKSIVRKSESRGTLPSGCEEFSTTDRNETVMGSISGLAPGGQPPFAIITLAPGGGYMLTLAGLYWEMRGPIHEEIRGYDCIARRPIMSNTDIVTDTTAVMTFPNIQGQIDPNNPKQLKGMMMYQEMDGDVALDVMVSWDFLQP